MGSTSSGIEIYVQGVNVDSEGAEKAFMATGVAEKTRVEFEKVIEVARQVASDAADGFATMAKKPSEISLEFGLTLGVKGGVPIFAEMSGEGSIKVGLVWKSAWDPCASALWPTEAPPHSQIPSGIRGRPSRLRARKTGEDESTRRYTRRVLRRSRPRFTLR
jgi:hypothetical protein